MSNSQTAEPNGGASLWQILKFYIPLAIQALSQSLTYPLVASIVSHGQYGATELAAFAQGQSLMFVFGAIGGGLITTGMVFGTSRTGMNNFNALVLRLAAVVTTLQVLVCLPPFQRIVFEHMLGLEGDLALIARYTVLLGIPMQLAFFVRNMYLVPLYNEKRSGLANTATMVRILITACLSPLFVKLGLTGYFVRGLVAMTLPIFGEVYLTRHFAKSILAALRDDEGAEMAPLAKQFHFTVPLSFGGIMLSISAFMMAIFLSRTDDPETTLTIHYIVMGIVNPLGFAALRMQSVVIGYPPAIHGERKIRVFAIYSGLVLSAIPLLLLLPSVANWYFGAVQNLSDDEIRPAQLVVLLMTARPLIQALRGRIEGIAALKRRPNAILTGQAVYLAAMVISLFLLVETKPVQGYFMGGIAILISLLVAALATVHVALIGNDFEESYGSPCKRAPAIDINQK